MAQWIKKLPHEHQDSSSHPQNSCKFRKGMGCIYNPSVQETEAGAPGSKLVS